MTKVLTDIDAIPSHAKIKLAFFDIDGTLLDKSGHFSPNIKAEIARIQSLGVKTAIASGRPYFAAQYITDQLNINDPGVFCTGAQIYSPREQKCLSSQCLKVEDCLKLLARLRQENIYYEIYTQDQFYVENDFASDIRQVHAQHLRCEPLVSSFDDIIASSPIVKFLVGVDETINDKILAQLEQEFPALIFAFAGLPAYPEWRFASIIDGAASKALMFDHLLDYYQIKAENVISFGDAQSDMVFLQKAGVGIAMGNAHSYVKDAANYVTKTAWQDGVVYALSRFI